MSWRSIPLRAVYRRVEELGREDLPLLSVYRDLGVVPREGRDDNHNRASEDLSNYKYVRPGDLVLNKMKTWQGSLGVSDYEGIVSPAYFVGRRVLDVDDRFMHHLLRSLPMIAEYGARSKGIRPSQWDLPWEEFASIRVAVPDRAAQRAIADYLDAETARIEALIAKKQRMIELLEERRGLYTRSVITGQGRSSAEDHSPRSAHLPILPDGWRWIRARFLCDIDTGSSDTDESSEDGPYLFFVRSQTPQRSHRFVFDGEAVLTAGDGAGVGKVFHHFVGRFDAHQRVYVMHRFRRVTGRYYFYALSTFFAESALDGSAKSTVDSVRRHMLTEMLVPVPPPEEQVRITSHLDAETERINATITKVEAQIGLLGEHRKALITAAVTGELKVPMVAA